MAARQCPPERLERTLPSWAVHGGHPEHTLLHRHVYSAIRGAATSIPPAQPTLKLVASRGKGELLAGNDARDLSSLQTAAD